MKKLMMLFLLVSGVAVGEVSDVFYVYQDGGSRLNHAIPAGWMGDFSSMKYNGRWDKNPGSGKSCIQVKYSGEHTQNAGWAGIYFQSVPQNWGNIKTKGYNLTGYKKLTFMARGEIGKEYIDKFSFGGISGENSFDTDQGQTDGIELTKEWKTYEIDLKGLDLSNIISPFCFVFNGDANPNGATIYIDEVKYVR